MYKISCILLIISGSLDHTLRVWSICHGTQVTVFDMHHPILELHITSDASRLVVQFAESKLLPILCLHNSPAGEIKSQSQINIQLSGGNTTLLQCLSCLDLSNTETVPGLVPKQIVKL